MAAIEITRKGERVFVCVDPQATPAELAVAVDDHPDLRGPVVVLITAAQAWAAALIAHEAHATRAVAIWADGLGYVVVQDHGAGYNPGDVIELEREV